MYNKQSTKKPEISIRMWIHIGHSAFNRVLSEKCVCVCFKETDRRQADIYSAFELYSVVSGCIVLANGSEYPLVEPAFRRSLS